VAGIIAAPEGRLNQLHCPQPDTATINVDAIVKTSSLFITVVSYQEMVDLRAHKSTKQLYTTFGSGQEFPITRNEE